MRRLSIVLVLGMVFALLAAPAQAKKPKLPHITGGGVTKNFNSVSPPGTVQLLTSGGFNGHATAGGAADVHPIFGTATVEYPAKGQVQGKNVLAADPSTKTGSFHGSVACIANLGPASGVFAFDFDPASNALYGGNDVWEIRFEITQVRDADNKKVDLEALLFPLTGPFYGSYLVQDNGSVDFQDESFAGALITNPDCGNVTFFDLEPHLQGSIKAH